MGNCNVGLCNRGQSRLPKRMPRSNSNTDYGGLGGATLLKIFEHLSPEDLARCCTVNQWWNKIGGTHRLWKEHCIEARLFEEDDVTCQCESDGTELKCALQSHYSRYMVYKSNFHEGHFSIHSFPWYPYEAPPMTGDSSMKQAPEQSVVSCFDETKLVIVCDFLKIWDVTVSPTQIFERVLIWKVTAVKIQKNILALLIENESDSSNQSHQKILVYQCIAYDPQKGGEELPLYMLPEVKTPESIALSYCFSVDVWLDNGQWHLSQDVLVTSCTINNHIYFFDVRSGIEKFKVEIQRGNKIINGQFVGKMYYYLLLTDYGLIPRVVFVALDTVKQSIQWRTELKTALHSDYAKAVILPWCRKELLVLCSYFSHMIDRGSGEIISVDDLVLRDQRKLSESSQRYHSVLGIYRQHVRPKLFYTFENMYIGPFGGILFMIDYGFTFMCGKERCSGKFTRIEDDNHGIRELIRRRETRIMLSRKQMILLNYRYNRIYVLNYTNDP